ncbi:disease resistance protein RPP4-like, partial [Arachis ipaensis]|uniref:disease resistance protein RPP4-like n=1 Tax=Arachis ipaensis TaxID=130454 RepID=UPI0007AF718D
EFEATHGIVLPYMKWTDLDIRDLAFSNMCKLKLLILDGVKVLILCDIPSTLKVLHWKGCPMETLPFKNQHYELVEIDLTYSKIVQLWDRKKVLKSKLRQTPDLSGVPNLKTFHLGQCKELNYIHPSLAHRKSLVELYLWKTKATRGIVIHKKYSETEVNQRDLSFSKMCRLKLLILDGVKAPILCDIPCTLKVFRWRNCPLKTLPLTDHQRYELVEINLSWSKIVRLWDGKKVLEKLEHLNLSECKQLKQTPDLSGAPNLKTLDLGGCERLETLGDKLEMSSLERLHLSYCSSLRRLPDLSGAPNLEEVHLDGCEELNYIHLYRRATPNAWKFGWRV